MAVYKVPQDVEAEDKLVGPFGFRQFVYLGIAAGSGFIAYLLFRISPFMVAIPLPIIGFFVILALPLRKEQPMETYLLALLRFYLKPKLRLWNPDGTITYVEIVVPKLVQQHLSKEYGAEVATERLDYLSRIMDSRGWSLKGQEQPGVSLKSDIAAEAQTATDVMDEGAALSQSFNEKIAQKDQERRELLMAQMRQAATQPTAQPSGTTSTALPPADDNTSNVHFNPYPTIHQRVIQPLGAKAAATPQPVVPKAASPAAKPPTTPPVSPDIIRLANNDDLSISAIAHEAHRLAESDEEVVVKLH